MPRLDQASWQVYRKPATASPSLLLHLELSGCEAAGSEAVNVEMSKEQLEALLQSLSKVNYQRLAFCHYCLFKCGYISLFISIAACFLYNFAVTLSGDSYSGDVNYVYRCEFSESFSECFLPLPGCSGMAT